VPGSLCGGETALCTCLEVCCLCVSQMWQRLPGAWPQQRGVGRSGTCRAMAGRCAGMPLSCRDTAVRHRLLPLTTVLAFVRSFLTCCEQLPAEGTPRPQVPSARVRRGGRAGDGPRTRASGGLPHQRLPRPRARCQPALARARRGLRLLRLCGCAMCAYQTQHLRCCAASLHPYRVNSMQLACLSSPCPCTHPHASRAMSSRMSACEQTLGLNVCENDFLGSSAGGIARHIVCGTAPRLLVLASGAVFLWDDAAVEVHTSELQADAAYVVLAHGTSHPMLRVCACPGRLPKQPCRVCMHVSSRHFGTSLQTAIEHRTRCCMRVSSCSCIK